MNYTFTPIGRVNSCFKEKFGIPRQSGLVAAATAQIQLFAPFDNLDAFMGLEGCSHIWVQFVFHHNKRQQWKPKVRPPRLGGNKSLGVFATRAPVRPNPIGLSVVTLVDIQHSKKGLFLNISGHDLLDGTPVLDIKPYVPYADCIPSAVNPIAPDAPPQMAVTYTDTAKKQCLAQANNLHQLIQQILQYDPRPQYQTPEPSRIYGMHLLDLNVRWRYLWVNEKWQLEVVEIVPYKDGVK